MIVRHLSSMTLVSAGIIHLLPLSGVFGPAQLQSLYGFDLADPNVIILMRHRAALFGLIGLFLIHAAFDAALQRTAYIAGLVSVTSFLWLASATGGYNASLSRVVVVDWFAFGLLLLGITGKLVVRSRSGESRPGVAGPVT